MKVSVNGRRQKRVKVVVCVTSAQSLSLLRGQLSYGKQRGYDSYVLCSPGEGALEFCHSEGVTAFLVPMEREPSAWRDLLALWRIFRVLRRERPEIVNAGTPKAGFLVTLGAMLAGIPIRIYTLRGLRFETETGLKRRMLILVEKIACALAHKVICISPSLRNQAITYRVVSPHKAIVLGSGSSNGVDINTFTVTDEVLDEARNVRVSLNIGTDEFVIGFVGRVVRDKGISELLGAWKELRAKYSHLHLLVVGHLEDEEYQRQLDGDEKIHYVGHIKLKEKLRSYYAAMDVLVLPSYREGFGNVLLEAAAMGVPVVATTVTGCVDAVVDGETGFLVPPRDPVQLADRIEAYILDPSLRQAHGSAGARRARTLFAQELVWDALYLLYDELVRLKGIERVTAL